MDKKKRSINLKEEQELFLTIHKLLSEQKLGALATHGQGEPWASLIAFAATDNLDSIYFATPKTTRKYSNLVNDPRCSLLIDNRENLASDFSNSIAVTATGVIKELDKSENSALYRFFLRSILIFKYLPSLPLVRSFVCRLSAITWCVVFRKSWNTTSGFKWTSSRFQSLTKSNANSSAAKAMHWVS